jgi:ABC-type branched-subunit amino acid transport system permease subunit
LKRAVSARWPAAAPAPASPAVAGWLYALNNSFVSQDLLELGNSLNGALYALVDGAEHVILGPLVGAAASAS